MNPLHNTILPTQIPLAILLLPLSVLPAPLTWRNSCCSLLPNAPPAQDFSKLGFVYITVLGLANQVVPHTGSWCPFATTVNYLVCIVPIVIMAFQAWPASPVGVQSDSDIGCYTNGYILSCNNSNQGFQSHH
ncbi:hypothetical protein DSO57_1019535 [Entomophthora muscae]|uniref:Uncharacterized protein n=1 Tax=Entomophthora muscae TaxID=34485 RepID=A0ACC2UPS9_9FUNG|nr:hypothetical protein DSO57_1019535 [Entomophthora muscae]